jgi:hypothetical protein
LNNGIFNKENDPINYHVVALLLFDDVGGEVDNEDEEEAVDLLSIFADSNSRSIADMVSFKTAFEIGGNGGVDDDDVDGDVVVIVVAAEALVFEGSSLITTGTDANDMDGKGGSTIVCDVLDDDPSHGEYM